MATVGVPKRGSNPSKPSAPLKNSIRATAVSTVEKTRTNTPPSSLPASKSEKVGTQHELPPSSSAPVITPAINDTGHMPFFYTTVTNILTSIRLDEGFVREFLGHLEYKIDRRYVRRLLLDKETRNQLGKAATDIQEFLGKQAYLEKIILTQSLARRFLVIKKFRDLSEHQRVLTRKYDAAFRSLIKHERDYVNDLNTLVNVYMAGLKKLSSESKPVIEPQDIAIVFWNLEQIYAYHQLSLKAFEEVRLNHWPFLEGLAAAVIKLVTNIGIYADYVNNFRTAQDAVSRLKKKPKFAATLEEIMQKNKVTIELQEMLSLPMEQLNVYEKSLEALLDSIPFPSSEEADGLTTAYSIIKSTSNVVKQSVEKSKNKATIMAIQRAIYGHIKGPLNLLTQNRFFLREAEVFYIGKKKSKRRLILFSDCFLVVKEKKEKEDKHLKFYLMESFQDGDVTDAESVQKFGFEIKASSGKHVFAARNADEKAMLMKDVRGIIQQLKSSRVFGTPLEILLKKEKEEKKRTTDIPILVERLVNEIINRGIHSEGIFRLSGSATNIQVLHKQLDDSVMMDLKNEDVYELAALLKMFFREFPEPLMTFALYDQMIELQKNFEYDSSISLYSHLSTVNSALATMPKANQTLLKYLLDFLRKITEQSSKNKMGPQNLAIVFGPNFLWPREETIQSTLNIPRVSALVQVMVENHSFILPASPLTEEEFNKSIRQEPVTPTGASDSAHGTLKILSPKGMSSGSSSVTYRQPERKDSSLFRGTLPRGSTYLKQLYSNSNPVNVPFTPPLITKDYLDSLASETDNNPPSDLCVDGVDLSQISPSPSNSMTPSFSSERLADTSSSFDGETSEESSFGILPSDSGTKIPPLVFSSSAGNLSPAPTSPIPSSLPSPSFVTSSLSPRGNLGKPAPSIRFGSSNNAASNLSSSSTPSLTSSTSTTNTSASPSFGQVKRPAGFALPQPKSPASMFGSAAAVMSSTAASSPSQPPSGSVSPRAGSVKPLPRPPNLGRKTGLGGVEQS